MKKRTLINTSVLATFVLAVFGWLRANDPVADQELPTVSQAAVVFNWRDVCSVFPEEVELVYDVAPRFVMTVTKEVLNKAKTIHDIVIPHPERTIVSYTSVSISIIDDNATAQITKTGPGPELTAAQLKLLHSVAYSTNLLIRTEYKEKNLGTEGPVYNYSTPHITVVPEKEAVCIGGRDALTAYARENTKEFATIIKKDELKAGKITFTVNTTGKVVNAVLTSTSGYPKFDKTMIELIGTWPGAWEPATNEKGEAVEQRLTFSYGIMGC